MSVKAIIYDVIVPTLVTGAVASANSVRDSLLQINDNINNHSNDFHSLVDEVIHTGTGISVTLGCFYMCFKIYETYISIKQKKS